MRAAIRAAGYLTMNITVPAGEESKSVSCAAEIWRAMAAQKLDRDCVVLALGGGVVGDLAGFAAATYMRGVTLLQVPTTLLAMVDSSVGGKTGIDLPAGKNLVGAFKQPVHVCADTAVLATLPDREWACGCAEIAKSALIDSDEFFFWLVDAADKLACRDSQVVQEAIARCVTFKAGVVAADVEERAGVRACLNYGHTLGHAIEKLAGYGTYSHGAAVAEGMRFAIRLGAALESTPLELVQEQDELLDQLGLPALDFPPRPKTCWKLCGPTRKPRPERCASCCRAMLDRGRCARWMTMCCWSIWVHGSVRGKHERAGECSRCGRTSAAPAQRVRPKRYAGVLCTQNVRHRMAYGIRQPVR